MFRSLAVLLLVLVGSAAGEARAAEPGLVEALRRGGHVLYLRHGDTVAASDEIREPGDWTSCDPVRMRQLSAAGRDESRATGEAIRALRVPVGRVLASAYCRTTETARLLDLGPVEATTDIFNLLAARWVGGADRLTETARRTLATPPAPGTNTVAVAHGNLISAVAGLTIGEGETAVFRPDGRGGLDLVARLTPAEWIELREALPSE